MPETPALAGRSSTAPVAPPYSQTCTPCARKELGRLRPVNHDSYIVVAAKVNIGYIVVAAKVNIG